MKKRGEGKGASASEAGASEANASERRRMRTTVRRLRKDYGVVRCYLDYSDPFELLVSTILSAQCTDVKVNEVSPQLFKQYPDAGAMARARLGTLEKLVRPTGFFRAKARSLKGVSAALAARYGGDVPGTMEELVELPGVGRKTASVVLGTAFGVPAIAVDTHVLRVTARLGFTKRKTPEQIEQDMRALVEKKDWSQFSLLVTTHGRRACIARKPWCTRCSLKDLCPYRGPSR